LSKSSITFREKVGERKDTPTAKSTRKNLEEKRTTSFREMASFRTAWEKKNGVSRKNEEKGEVAPQAVSKSAKEKKDPSL